MLFKNLFSEEGMQAFGSVIMTLVTVAALVAFLMLVVWIYCRPQQQIDAAAHLWKDDEN